jgi:predicted outer membrane lipoprotein
MREVVIESRACGACGAFVSVSREGGAVVVKRRGGTFFRDKLYSLLSGVPRERSGLAYAAGYAGLLSLFRYSFTYLTVSGWWPAWVLGTGLALIFSMLAPLALVLSFSAAVSLERSPWKSGTLPTFVGFMLGWQGSYTALFLLDEIWQWLASLG